MKAKTGTYRITFKDGTQIVVGNNYKPWHLHATEFAYDKYRNRLGRTMRVDVVEKLSKVEYSPSLFIDNGGLKWAGFPDAYEQVRWEVAEKKKIVIAPISHVVFEYSPVDTKKLIKEMERY